MLKRYKEMLDKVDKSYPIFIGGNGMGARIGTAIAAETKHKIAGIVAIGYPFTKAGKIMTINELFGSIKVPFLII